MPGTENAGGAAFSPDGDWIVYATQTPDALLKVSLSGGAPTPVVPSGDVSPREPHWGDDGTIVFGSPTGIYRVSDTGGEPVRLSEQGPFLSPSLLPGGRAVIGTMGGGGVVLLDLETDSVRELIPSGRDPQYVETGHILYADGSGGLWALPFDANRLEVLGGAVPIFDGVRMLGNLFARYFVSRNGTLVYGTGGGRVATQQRMLVVDLEGNEEPMPLDPRVFRNVRWSTDGGSVAYSSGGAGEFDIYTYNVALRTSPRRVTSEGLNIWPVWSPDGTQVAFTSRRDGTAGFDLFVKTLNDNSPPQMILTLPDNQDTFEWPSEDLVIFETGRDLWMLDLSSDSGGTSLYLDMEGYLQGMTVSPDGDLAAYTFTESGTEEVYVRSFPEARQPEIVSRGGGQWPLWSPEGNTIYYWTRRGPDAVQSLIAARIERGPPFVVISRDTVLTGTYDTSSWDLHPDGDRLVIPQTVAVPGAEAGAWGQRIPEDGRRSSFVRPSRHACELQPDRLGGSGGGEPLRVRQRRGP